MVKAGEERDHARKVENQGGSRKLTRDEQIEELEREDRTRIQLGYKPEAAPPDLANARSRLDNKHNDKKLKKKPSKGQPNRKEYVLEAYWPPTPEKEKPEKNELEEDDHPVYYDQRKDEPEVKRPSRQRRKSHVHSIDEPPPHAKTNDEPPRPYYNTRNNDTYRKLRDENNDDDFYIRESQSAPLDTPQIRRNPQEIAEALMPSRPRTTESQKAFDVFRPPGYQRPVRSGDSQQYLLNGINEGVYVADHPLPMHELDEDYEDDYAKQMWLEAERDLKKDNRRYQMLQEQKEAQKQKDEKKPKKKKAAMQASGRRRRRRR